MMSLTFGLFTQVNDSGPHGPLVLFVYSLLPKDLTFQNTFSFTAAGITCRKMAVKRLIVIYSAAV